MTTERLHPQMIIMAKEARKRGIREEEVFRDWEEMVQKYDFPIWVTPKLITDANGEAELSPAVPPEALPEIHRLIPDFEDIRGPVWVNGRRAR